MGLSVVYQRDTPAANGCAGFDAMSLPVRVLQSAT